MSGTVAVESRHIIGAGTAKRILDADVFYIILYYAIYALAVASLFVTLGGDAPLPFQPIDTTPNWASWFDIYITFPVMSGFCLYAFRGTAMRRLAFPMALFFPIYLIGYSYLNVFSYSYIPLLYAGVFSSSLIVPVILLFLVPALPLAGSLITMDSLRHGCRPETRFSGRMYFIIMLAAAFTLSAVEIILRYMQSSSMYVNLSDVGYTMQAGGTMLLHGGNPYVSPLPPWNAPISLAAGPLTFVFTAPMGVFPVVLAAHLSTLIFTILLALGLYYLVGAVLPDYRLVATAFFFSLPIMVYEFMAVPIIHFMVAACIVWSLYFFVSGRKTVASFIALIGTGVMLIPAALMVPYIWQTRGRERLYVSLIFFVPLAVALYFGRSLFNLLNIDGYLSLSGLIGFYYGFVISQGLADALRWIPVSVFLVWFFYASARSHNGFQVLRTSAIFYLMLPFMFGDFGAFYYIWEYVLVLPAFLSYAGAGMKNGSGRS